MSAIVIKADRKSNKILSELAKRLGGDVMAIDDEQLEDLMLGKMMEESRTGELVDKDKILKSLKS
ncbi:MAG: hypothetical protein RLO17_17540 [Cyclobacteriaceae bacterium]